MSFDHYVSLFSATISFIGLLLVVRQLRDGIKQRESQSLVEIHDINRQLLSLGFSHPQLFAILDDDKHSDPVLERRYLQLWLNQLSLIHTYLKASSLRGEFKDSLISELSDFFAHKNMQKHWRQRGVFYPASFQKLVNDLIKKNEPPRLAATAQPDASDSSG